jgi:hypothetical protein
MPKFYFSKSNFNNGNENLIEIIDYLIKIKEPAKLIEDELSYEAIFFLYQISEVREFFSLIDWNIYAKKDCHLLFSQIVNYLYLIRNDLDFEKDTIELENIESECNLNKRRISVFYYIIKLINSIVSKSVTFGLKFNQTIGLESFILIIKDENFFMKVYKSKVKSILNSLLANLNWLSKISEDTNKKWHDMDIINCLMRLIKIDGSFKFCAYQTMINIANDNEIESISEINLISLEFIKKWLDKAASDFEQNKFFREKKEFLEDKNQVKVYDVHLIEGEFGFVALTSILIGLYRLSINDKTRHELFYNLKILEPLKRILDKGSCIEIDYSLKLIAQLSFNNQIVNDLLKDKELIEIVRNLKSKEGGEICFKKACNQLGWNMKQKVDELNTKNKTPPKPEKQTCDKHIMISYNTGSRDLCLRIKQSLEDCGFKIWIDVNEIYGSSLEAMAKAVEDSFCVLMCVTEKYRQSVNCQSEAQYAFKLNKKIIPIIMQQGYESVQGWLGIIMGDKIYINFTKYDFDECMKRLKNEINLFISSIAKTNEKENKKNELDKADKVKFTIGSASSVSIISNISSNKNVEKWSEQEVIEWFNSNDLNISMLNHLKPIDGEILKQLWELKTSAPDYYYTSFEKSNAYSLRSTLMLTSRLNNLFQNL